MPSTHNGQTDQILKIKLTSAIHLARWMDGEAGANGEARLEVSTTFVGNGAPVKITIKDQEGKTVGSLDGVVWSDLFRSAFKLAGVKATALAFEAELPKHSLKKTSGPLKVHPPVEFSNLKFTDPEGKALAELTEGKQAACEASVKGLKEGDPVDMRIALVLHEPADEGVTFLEARVAVKAEKVRLLFMPAVRVPLERIRVQQALDKEGGKYHHPQFMFSCEARGCRKESAPAKAVQSLVLHFEEKPGMAGKLEGKQITLIAPDGKKESKTIPKDGKIEVPKSQPGLYKVKGDIVKDLKPAEKRPAPEGTPVPITGDDKKRIVEYVATFEGGRGKAAFSAINPDLEFEGYWDTPKRWYKDKTRAMPDGFDPHVPYSKYFGHPRHVGLTFGLIQFTQESSLGALLKKMEGKDKAKFKEIFGEHSDALLAMTAKTGDIELFEEELADNTGAAMGKKKVGRRPSVHPVGGHELWHSYWTKKFKASGEWPAFQEAQVECAVEKYMDACIKLLKGKGLKSVSEKTLAIFFDRQVNGGGGATRKYLAKYTTSAEAEKDFWDKQIKATKGSVGARMRAIYDSGDVAWEKLYEL